MIHIFSYEGKNIVSKKKFTSVVDRVGARDIHTPHTPRLGPAVSFRQRHGSHYSTGCTSSLFMPIFRATAPDV